jgi:acetylornithine deacetylase/succinyl-diaminopimelate desuccinylase-like protein
LGIEHIKLPELYVEIPQQRIEQAKEAARTLGRAIYETLPFATNTRPMAADLTELVLNRTWRPQLAVIGMDGYPSPENAGNVLLPYSTAKLSMRLPPTLDGERAVRLLKAALQAEPPYRAEIRFDSEAGQSGWNAPALAPWLEKSVARASEEAFGRPPAYMGEGGSIPFMAMLGEKFLKPSLSSRAFWDRIPTRTGRTNFSTSQQARASQSR